jgi:uncharacterized protein YqgV (UPF0045/DUF77 family)
VKILVEQSAISVGGNGQVSDQKADVLKVVENAGVFYSPTRDGACIEGEWNEISTLIYTCYERVQEQSSQGYLRVSIR